MRFLLALLLLAAACSRPAENRVAAPRIWNDRDLAEWALPVAGLNVRPDHFTEAEYYAGPVAEWVRTYPVYFPGREPAGYWETIQGKKPEPLLTPGARTEAEWIEAGARVFEEMDVPVFRNTDPELIKTVRSLEAFQKLGGHPQSDGRVQFLRWVPTAKGLAISITDCASCHVRTLAGKRQLGAPFDDPGDGVVGRLASQGTDLFFGGDSPAMIVWRSFAVPWVPGDVHERLKSMSEKEFGELSAALPPGVFARTNGSVFYPTQAPDLAGIKDRKYIDHTATHRLRGPEDIARYAILVSCCDSAGFGPHQMLAKEQRKIVYRFTDEIVFALGKYLFSLEPLPNPVAGGPQAEAGEAVFKREGCVGCHTPPSYTNNKLTLAAGFTPPAGHPAAADILPMSVNTDPNLALRTRKGTGLYKVPSLRGIWRRTLLSHDGSVASLEDWFDPRRLRDDYVPTGFKGYKVEHRAVPGHEFGLRLSAGDKAALLAFLRSL